MISLTSEITPISFPHHFTKTTFFTHFLSEKLKKQKLYVVLFSSRKIFIFWLVVYMYTQSTGFDWDSDGLWNDFHNSICSRLHYLYYYHFKKQTKPKRKYPPPLKQPPLLFYFIFFITSFLWKSREFVLKSHLNDIISDKELSKSISDYIIFFIYFAMKTKQEEGNLPSWKSP